MINAAIVGLGRWGQNLVRAVDDSARIRFARAVTRTPAKAEAFCAERGIALGDDYAAALADPEVQAVVLATPHVQHHGQIVAAAEAGKHVFCEKPFTLTKASAQEAVAACRSRGLVAAVGQNRRFMASFATLKRLIEDGTLGTPMHIEGVFAAPLSPGADEWRADRAESPAGGMTSLGIHVLDSFVYLFGRIRELDALSVHRALPVDLDDSTAALIAFESGATGTLGTLWGTAPAFSVRVFGSKGWAALQGHDRLTVMTGDGPPATESFDIDPRGPASLKAELEAFAAAAAEGGPAFPIPPDEIVHVVAALEAMTVSAEQGGRAAV